MFAGTTRTRVSTCARGAGTHGGVLNLHTEGQFCSSFSSLQRTVEQNVGIPVVGGSGAGGGLSGFLPGQSYSFSAEQIVDNPLPRPGGAGDLQGLSRGQSSTAFSEQIAEFPDPVAAVKIFSQSRAPQCLPQKFSWTSWSRGF